MTFDIYQRRRLAYQAKHIQGSLSALLALEKTSLTEYKIREVINDIFHKTDEFIYLLDEIVDEEISGQ